MDLRHTIDTVRTARRGHDAARALLVAISGIDGAGKGWVADRIVEALRGDGLRVAKINADGWLRLPRHRFSETEPANHFYRYALRFDEMFTDVVLPLRDERSVFAEHDFVSETATDYERRWIAHRDVDVIVLEGIFLLKASYRGHADMTVWVDCSFETALDRAIARSQEGLDAERTIEAYERIYFPAQRIHFERDAPREHAGIIVCNDPRLETAVADASRSVSCSSDRRSARPMVAPIATSRSIARSRSNGSSA